MEMLEREIAAFRTQKASEVVEARQRVALRLACGIDLPDLRQADQHALTQALARIKRAIQRERMKAARAHWSYDLNRHIALKQVCDELRQSLSGPAEDVRTHNHTNEKRRPKAPSEAAHA